jgi:hypothetical protein
MKGGVCLWQIRAIGNFGSVVSPDKPALALIDLFRWTRVFDKLLYNRLPVEMKQRSLPSPPRCVESRLFGQVDKVRRANAA